MTQVLARRHARALSLALGLLSGCAAPAPEVRPAPIGWKIHTSPPVSAATDRGAAHAAPRAGTEYFGLGTAGAPHENEAVTKPGSNAKKININFQDADVRGVASAILGEMLKLNYSIDPAVQGKITLRTGSPIMYDSVLPALEAALSTVSAAILVQDGLVQVVPLESVAKRASRAQRIDTAYRQLPGFAIEIIPLRYVSAREIQRVLESFAPKGSILQADDAHNHLVIAGTSQDRDAIRQTVAGFDMDGIQGMSFALYKTEQTDPDQLVAELRQIFQPPLELVTQRVRLVSIPRMQSILGISKHRADLELLELWIRKLDGASKLGGRRLFVYKVQNGIAKDLARGLQIVFDSGGDEPQAAPKGNEAAPAQMPSQGERRGRIVANDDNNSLLVFATEQEYRTLREVLKQIDVRPRQVMIEAMLAEVALGDNLRYGLQWFFSSGENTITLSSADTGAVASQFPGFSLLYSGSANARLVLNALKAHTDVKILSSPKLTVLNNQKAELSVGDQIPILTQVAQGTSAPGAPIVTSIQMRDTGVILEVTPRIGDDGNVILEVMQEVSDVATTTTSGIDSPTIQRRRIRSVVATRDGATVALGGLIREARNTGKSGVPLLGDLPVVGNLFRSNSTESRRTELLVLLVPHIMRDPADTQAIVDALLESMPATSELTNHAIPIRPAPRP